MSERRTVVIAEDNSLTVEEIAEIKKLINYSRLGKLLFWATCGLGAFASTVLGAYATWRGIK